MTETILSSKSGGAAKRCRWCRRALNQQSGRGRPREFCSQKCRQWDWVSRQRAADLALGADEIVVRRDELDRLHDDLYMLTCAVEDVERDLGDRPSNRELTDALRWVLDAAQPLHNREISAPAAESNNSS